MDAAANSAAAVFAPSAGAALGLGSGGGMGSYTLRSLFILLLYYADLGTDIALLVDLASDPDQVVMAALVGAVLVLHVAAISVYDLFAAGGLRWKGVALNVTFLRLPYILLSPKLRGVGTADAMRSGDDVKLLEALLESAPQLYIQTVLLIRSPPVPGTFSFNLLVVSLVFSVGSIAFAQSRKLLAMLGGGSGSFLVRHGGILLYFVSDAVLRAAAFAVVFVAHGAFLAAWLGVWFAVELATEIYLTRQDGWHGATRGIPAPTNENNADGARTKAIANAARGVQLDRRVATPFRWGNILCLCAKASPRCTVHFCPFGDVCFVDDGFSSRNDDIAKRRREEKANCLCIEHPEFLCFKDEDGSDTNPCGSCFFDCVSDWRTYHCGLPFVWLLRVLAVPFALATQVPGHRKQLAAAGLALLTSFPLSTQVRDRLRLFAISTVVAVAMVVAAAATEWPDLDTPIIAAAVAAGVKMLVYGGVVHGMEGRDGESTTATGFSVFSMDSNGEALMGSWSATDWAKFFEDEKNNGWDGYNELTASSILALLDGAKLVLDDGGKCAGFGATALFWRGRSLGDDGGETLARMAADNDTLQVLDMGMDMLWRDAGVAVGRMLETNTSLKSLKLDKNNLIIDDKERLAPAAILKGLAANTTLRELFLQWSGCKDGEITAMKEACPTCSITDDQDGAVSGLYLSAERDARLQDRRK